MKIRVLWATTGMYWVLCPITICRLCYKQRHFISRRVAYTKAGEIVKSSVTPWSVDGSHVMIIMCTLALFPAYALLDFHFTAKVFRLIYFCKIKLTSLSFLCSTRKMQIEHRWKILNGRGIHKMCRHRVEEASQSQRRVAGRTLNIQGEYD